MTHKLKIVWSAEFESVQISTSTSEKTKLKFGRYFGPPSFIKTLYCSRTSSSLLIGQIQNWHFFKSPSTLTTQVFFPVIYNFLINWVMTVSKWHVGHKLIPTRSQVALDYKLSTACKTLVESRGFLGFFGPQSSVENTLLRQDVNTPSYILLFLDKISYTELKNKREIFKSN